MTKYKHHASRHHKLRGKKKRIRLSKGTGDHLLFEGEDVTVDREKKISVKRKVAVEINHIYIYITKGETII